MPCLPEIDFYTFTFYGDRSFIYYVLVNELEEQGKKSIEAPTTPTAAISPDSFQLGKWMICLQVLFRKVMEVMFF